MKGFVFIGVASLALHAHALQYDGFDNARASSVYSGGVGFGAEQALSANAGYWCSAGGHGPAQVVSWTGTLTASRRAVGVSLHWAYSPSEIQILTSPDGDNFESACWRKASQQDASYTEHIAFEQALPVRSLTVLMRGPRSWNYFGLNGIALLTEPGPIMLVSGMTAPGGERCIVSTGGGLSLAPCVDAIASGTGSEVFRLSEGGLLMSASTPNQCAFLADGDATGGGSIALASCRTVGQADDGRGIFKATSDGQLRLGSACVVANDGGLGVKECEEAAKLENAGDKFFQLAVPEVDTSRAGAARSSANLAAKSAGRLGGLIAQLTNSMSACGLKQNQTSTAMKSPTTTAKSSLLARKPSLTHDAIISMSRQLNVDSIPEIIAHARQTLKVASEKL